MRFHILGLSHTKIHRDYSACAFTQKVRLLCRMLHALGHVVYLYAPQGSEADCTEMVPVLDEATFQSVHGGYDWRTQGFLLGRDNVAYTTFRDNAIAAIRKRAHPGDFLLCPFGLDHEPIAAALGDMGLIVVESGIGYNDTFAPYRVWESFAWMHIQYGREQRHLTPPWYDAVIPNAFDLADYPYVGLEGKGGYFLYVARPNHDKGLSIAKDVAQAVGLPLYTAGQGTPEQWAGCDHHLGVLSIEKRAIWMGGARAVLCPSLYVEPFCNVHVEAALCGTPVLTTDWGAFTETVIHGVTGFRCRTLPEFIAAARVVDQIKPQTCRRWAASQFSLERVGALYQDYFERVAGLFGGKRGDWYGQPQAARREEPAA